MMQSTPDPFFSSDLDHFRHRHRHRHRHLFRILHVSWVFWIPRQYTSHTQVKRLKKHDNIGGRIIQNQLMDKWEASLDLNALVVLDCRTCEGREFQFRIARETNDLRANSERTLGSCSCPSAVARVPRSDTAERLTTRSRNTSGAWVAFRICHIVVTSCSAIMSSTEDHPILDSTGDTRSR